MSEGWPPEEYSAPLEYVKNERFINGFGIFLIVAFGAVAILPIVNGVEAYRGFLESAAGSLGIHNVPTSLEVMSVIISLLLLFKFIIVPIHEALHYGVGLLLNMNPDFGYEDGLLLDNPRVVALSTEIPVWKNLAMIVEPFAVIGGLSWG